MKQYKLGDYLGDNLTDFLYNILDFQRWIDEEEHGHTIHLRKEVVDWLTDNCENWRFDDPAGFTDMTFYFDEDSYFIAFKLRWI